MSLSTPLTPAANPAATHCSTASWCVSHRETHPNVVLHLSSLDVSAGGTVTGIKAYSWGDGEPIGGATVSIFSPLDRTRELEDWQHEWMQDVFAAA
jgi:hypothetical protein